MDKRNKTSGFFELFLSLEHIKIIISVLVLIFLTGLSVISWYISQQAELILREQKIEVLNSIVQTTHKSIDEFWLKKHKLDILQWASDSRVIKTVRELQASGISQEQLLNHPSQNKLRQYFEKKLIEDDHQGMFVISPERINLASMRDINVGDVNLIEKYRPKLLQKVFLGEFQIIPPIPSDVMLADDSGRMIEGYHQ